MTHLTFYWSVLLAAESAKPSGGLFDFDATLPIMAVQFLLLVVILKATFFKPLTKAIDERNDYVRGNIAEAKERLAKAQLLAQQFEQELASARKQAQNIILSAQADANKIRTQQIAVALTESQAQVANAKAEIEQQKQAVSESLNAQVEALSHQIISKLLGNLSSV